MAKKNRTKDSAVANANMPHGRPVGRPPSDKTATVGTRLTDDQLAVVQKAAKLRGWTVAKFMQTAAVERAVETINRHENRGGLVPLAAQLHQRLCVEQTPSLTVMHGGQIWDYTGEWEDLDHSRRRDFLVKGAYLGINERTAAGDLEFKVYKHGCTREELPDLLSEIIDNIDEHTPELIVAQHQPGLGINPSAVCNAIYASGREFADLLEQAQFAAQSGNQPALIDAKSLLETGND